MHRFVIVVLVISLGYDLEVQAQQTTMWSGGYVDEYLYNPAAAGFQKSLAIHGFYRNQWKGIEGGPSSQSFIAHLPMYILSGGLGGQWVRETSGPIIRSTFGASYNYVFPSHWGFLSVGGAVSLQDYALNGAWLRTPEGEYDAGIDHRDPVLSDQRSGGSSLGSRVGLFWDGGSWKGGVFYNHPIGGRVRFSDGVSTYQAESVGGGHLTFNRPWKGMAWEAHVLVISDFRQLQTFFGINLLLPNNICIGVAFRGYAKASADALVLSGGLRLNEHFRLLYSFDYVISELNQTETNNTHEFALSYNLNKPIRTGLPPRIIYNPRY